MGLAMGSGPPARSPRHAALTPWRSARGAPCGKLPGPPACLPSPQGNAPVLSALSSQSGLLSGQMLPKPRSRSTCHQLGSI